MKDEFFADTPDVSWLVTLSLSSFVMSCHALTSKIGADFCNIGVRNEQDVFSDTAAKPEPSQGSSTYGIQDLFLFLTE